MVFVWGRSLLRDELGKLTRSLFAFDYVEEFLGVYVFCFLIILRIQDHLQIDCVSVCYYGIFSNAIYLLVQVAFIDTFLYQMVYMGRKTAKYYEEQYMHMMHLNASVTPW